MHFYMSTKVDLAEQQIPTETVLFLVALVTKYDHFRFGSILHCCVGSYLDNVLPGVQRGIIFTCRN